jgi:hypothetical protein
MENISIYVLVTNIHLFVGGCIDNFEAILM